MFWFPQPRLRRPSCYRVHVTRNAQDLVPRSARSMVASAIRSIFEEPDEASARAQLGRVVDGLRPRFPAVADLLITAEGGPDAPRRGRAGGRRGPVGPSLGRAGRRPRIYSPL